MQISRFLANRPSGFFCVDLPFISEPYAVQNRIEELMELSEEHDQGIRLTWEDNPEQSWTFSQEKPSLCFFQDRWPRFTWARSDKPNDPTPANASTQTGDSKQPENTGRQKTVEELKAIELSVQYFCSEGVVFQQYTWQRKGVDSLAKLPAQFSFDSNLLIRDLDFIDGDNHFNEWGLDHDESGYFRLTMSQDRSLVIKHMFSDETRGKQKLNRKGEYHSESWDPFIGVGLVITSFAYDTAQEMCLAEDGMCEVILSDETEAKFQETKILQITMAYRLQMISRNEGWKSTLINAEKLDKMREVLQDGMRIPRPVFSSHPHLNFIIRRNLEHILSVCSIPMRQFPIVGSQVPSDGDAQIALTCGDISGHRITSSASLWVSFT